MRQALSMAIDREAFADVYENRANFAKDGLDNSVSWNSSLSPAWQGAYLNPHDEKEFGPNSKYYKFNLAEAKKLVAAAGFTNAEFDFYHNSEQTYGAGYARQVQIYQRYVLSDLGLKPNQKGLPYATWLAQYHYGYIPATYNAGQTKGFNGIGLGAERQRYTSVLSVYGLVHPEGDAFHGATPDGNNAVKGDPKLSDMLGKLRQEIGQEQGQRRHEGSAALYGAADVLHPEAVQLDPVHGVVAGHRQRRRLHVIGGRRQPLGRAQPAVVARHQQAAFHQGIGLLLRAHTTAPVLPGPLLS